MYALGRGIPQDDVKAHMWWKAQGDKDAIKARDLVTKQMDTPINL